MATKEELEDQLAKTRTDMKVLASMAAERVEHAASDMNGAARDQAKMLSDEAQYMLTEALNEGKRVAGRAEDAMRANPLATAGIALGVGMLLGAMLRR